MKKIQRDNYLRHLIEGQKSGLVRHDDFGITPIGLRKFLLDEHSLEA